MFCVGWLPTLTTHRPRVVSHTPVQKRVFVVSVFSWVSGSTETVLVVIQSLGAAQVGATPDMWNREEYPWPTRTGGSLPSMVSCPTVMRKIWFILACPFCAIKKICSIKRIPDTLVPVQQGKTEARGG